ncbi:RsfA family transcriptional regulator [Bacillus songklensis]|uniref:RsfA family transcriptional regulator n=1 Tax=Bacillus songklensis TaxID=1069116 RepID=A0ABV8AYL1_9BACI
MVKVRQDAWSHDDDLLLAETVLQYIREGSTQLAAFDEVGDKLNRTSAACGFRWNAEVRKRYEEAIALAKKQRKERKRALEHAKKNVKNVSPPSAVLSLSAAADSSKDHAIEEYATELIAPLNNMSLNDVIQFLCKIRSEQSQSNILAKENETLRKENEQLALENKQLETKLEQLQKQQVIIQEDYQTLLQIMNRAQQMMLFEEREDIAPPFLQEDQTDTPPLLN